MEQDPKPKIIDFALEYCGQDGEQYFSGRTAMFPFGGMQYDEVYTGAGDTTREAYDEILDQLGMEDAYDTSILPEAGDARFMADIGDDSTEGAKAMATEKELEEDGPNDEWHCYVALYVKFDSVPSTDD